MGDAVKTYVNFDSDLGWEGPGDDSVKSGYENREMPEDVTKLAEFLYAVYVQTAMKQGKIWPIPTAEDLRKSIVWWVCSFNLGLVTVCAFLYSDQYGSTSKKFGYLKSEEDKTVMVIADSMDELEDGKGKTVKSIFTDRQRETVFLRDKFLRMARENDFAIFAPLAAVLTSYRQKEAFDHKQTDYLTLRVEPEEIAHKIYCIHQISDKSIAFSADLSDYGLGSGEIVSYNFGSEGTTVFHKQNGKMIPLEPTALPDPNDIAGFVPTLGNRDHFQITGYSGLDDGRSDISYVMKCDDEYGNYDASGIHPLKDIHADIAFYIDYQGGFVEHPLLNGINAYCLMEDGIIYAESSGLYISREGTGPVRIPTGDLKPGDILKISCKDGEIVLNLFDHLGERTEADVLVLDFFEGTQITYHVFTRKIKIKL